MINWLRRVIGIWKHIDDLERRVKAIETDIINKRAEEANKRATPPAVTFAEDSGEVWFKVSG